tara:strand:- start:102 stop:305 length:204 start_codon:yes stop_codon:yes gene_type:complete
MKKFIPTIFTAALAISSVSLLVGCGGIEEDPDAAANEAQEPTEKDADNSDLSDGEKKKMDDAINPPD